MSTKALHILITDGNSNGLKVIDLAGWIGKCFVVPRQSLKVLKHRSEINQPGLYFLFGKDEETDENLVYIGESESFYNRIENHNSNKDFWSTAVIFTGGLNRAHVKYLEYCGTTLATKANRMIVQNKVLPQENVLSEFEKVTVDQYFENIRFILSVFQFEVFEIIEELYVDNTLYYLNTNGITAIAKVLESGEMLVLKGATARISETESFEGWSKVARQRFLKENILTVKDSNFYELTQDTIFKSPSAAAATLTGRSINGWTAWKDEKGSTLDENLRN